MKRVYKITQDNILAKINSLFNKLPDRYVISIRCNKTKGNADISSGRGSKFELKYWIFDSELNNWKEQVAIVQDRFRDTDGIVKWNEKYRQLRTTVNSLINNENCSKRS